MFGVVVIGAIVIASVFVTLRRSKGLTERQYRAYDRTTRDFITRMEKLNGKLSVHTRYNMRDGTVREEHYQSDGSKKIDQSSHQKPK